MVGTTATRIGNKDAKQSETLSHSSAKAFDMASLRNKMLYAYLHRCR